MMDFNRRLGLEPGSAPGSVEMETRDEHLAAPETVHFAVLTTLAEVSAAGAVGRPVVPTSVNVQLLRRARPGRLSARGEVLKAGRRLAFAEGRVYRGDELVAAAQVTFAVLDR